MEQTANTLQIWFFNGRRCNRVCKYVHCQNNLTIYSTLRRKFTLISLDFNAMFSEKYFPLNCNFWLYFLFLLDKFCYGILMWRKLFVKFQMDQKWTNFWDNRMDDFERNLNLKMDLIRCQLQLMKVLRFWCRFVWAPKLDCPHFLMKKETTNVIWIAFSIRWEVFS